MCGCNELSIWRHQNTRCFSATSRISFGSVIIIRHRCQYPNPFAQQSRIFVLFALRTQTSNSLIKTIQADRSGVEIRVRSHGPWNNKNWVYLHLCLSIDFGTTSRFERVAGVRRYVLCDVLLIRLLLLLLWLRCGTFTMQTIWICSVRIGSPVCPREYF